MSSGFITETEIVEARKRRQEEWDKVRTADQPAEAPEEQYDSRPLFQRLEEQKQKKDAEYEETHKLKNMIRGLDDDEVGFLDLVERTKETVARQISLEEQREMQEFREKVSNLQEQAEKERLALQIGRPAPRKSAGNGLASTRSKLQGVIVRKRKLSDVDNNSSNGVTSRNGMTQTKNVVEEMQASEEKGKAISGTAAEPNDNSNSEVNVKGANGIHSDSATSCPSVKKGALLCVGILPGLGPYTEDSSDSEEDSDESPTKQARFDLLGRSQLCTKKLENPSKS